MVEYRNRSVVRQWSEYMPSTQTIQVGTSLKVTFFVTMLFEKKNVSEKQTGVGSYKKDFVLFTGPLERSFWTQTLFIEKTFIENHHSLKICIMNQHLQRQ